MSLTGCELHFKSSCQCIKEVYGVGGGKAYEPVEGLPQSFYGLKVCAPVEH